jgi:hypothetical protein
MFKSIPFLLFAVALGQSLAWGLTGPVEYIMKHNPEIQAVARYNRSWLKDLKVTTKADAGMATPSSSDEDSFTNINPGNAEWEYQVKIIAELPLISPKEKMDFRLKEHKLRRTIRRKAAKLITDYMELKSWIKKEKAIIADMVEELAWVEKRVQHGLESQKDFIGQTLDLKERMQELDQKKVELRYMLVDILSFVEKRDRPELEKLVRNLE